MIYGEEVMVKHGRTVYIIQPDGAVHAEGYCPSLRHAQELEKGNLHLMAYKARNELRRRGAVVVSDVERGFNGGLGFPEPSNNIVQ